MCMKTIMKKSKGITVSLKNPTTFSDKTIWLIRILQKFPYFIPLYNPPVHFEV